MSLPCRSSRARARTGTGALARTDEVWVQGEDYLREKTLSCPVSQASGRNCQHMSLVDTRTHAHRVTSSGGRNAQKIGQTAFGCVLEQHEMSHKRTAELRTQDSTQVCATSQPPLCVQSLRQSMYTHVCMAGAELMLCEMQTELTLSVGDADSVQTPGWCLRPKSSDAYSATEVSWGLCGRVQQLLRQVPAPSDHVLENLVHEAAAHLLFSFILERRQRLHSLLTPRTSSSTQLRFPFSHLCKHTHTHTSRYAET